MKTNGGFTHHSRSAAHTLQGLLRCPLREQGLQLKDVPEDDANLIYVAITRAKMRLVVNSLVRSEILSDSADYCYLSYYKFVSYIALSWPCMLHLNMYLSKHFAGVKETTVGLRPAILH